MYIIEQNFSDGYTNIFIFNSSKECDEFTSMDKNSRLPNTTVEVVENKQDIFRWLTEWKIDMFKKKKILTSKINVGEQGKYLVISPYDSTKDNIIFNGTPNYNYSKLFNSYEESWEELTRILGDDIYDLDQQDTKEFTDLIDNCSINVEYAAFKNKFHLYCIIRCD